MENMDVCEITSPLRLIIYVILKGNLFGGQLNFNISIKNYTRKDLNRNIHFLFPYNEHIDNKVPLVKTVTLISTSYELNQKNLFCPKYKQNVHFEHPF